MRRGLNTRVGERLRALTEAGDCIEVSDEHVDGIQRLRIAVNQASKVMGMTVESRTIDGQLWVMRRSHDHSVPLPALPGIPALAPSRPTPAQILNSFRPWPDDPDYAAVNRTIDDALLAFSNDPSLGAV